jgi:hypothetical protein
MKYQICSIESKEVHVPSDSYYARSGDSSTESIRVINPFSELFDSFEEALAAAKTCGLGEYTILPIITIN